jgi:hypothetical protein
MKSCFAPAQPVEVMQHSAIIAPRSEFETDAYPDSIPAHAQQWWDFPKMYLSRRSCLTKLDSVGKVEFGLLYVRMRSVTVKQAH